MCIRAIIAATTHTRIPHRRPVMRIVGRKHHSRLSTMIQIVNFLIVALCREARDAFAPPVVIAYARAVMWIILGQSNEPRSRSIFLIHVGMGALTVVAAASIMPIAPIGAVSIVTLPQSTPEDSRPLNDRCHVLSPSRVCADHDVPRCTIHNDSRIARIRNRCRGSGYRAPVRSREPADVTLASSPDARRYSRRSGMRSSDSHWIHV